MVFFYKFFVVSSTSVWTSELLPVLGILSSFFDYSSSSFNLFFTPSAVERIANVVVDMHHNTPAEHFSHWSTKQWEADENNYREKKETQL